MSFAKEYGYTGVYDRSHIKLGEIALMQNERFKAKDIFTDCLKSFNNDSEKLKLILSILGLGNYFFIEENYEKSIKLFFLADRINEKSKFKFSRSRLEENKRTMDLLKIKLTDYKFNSLLNEVKTWDLDKSVDLALSELQ